MNYSKLEVQEGQEAQAVWTTFVLLDESDEKERFRAELLEYCRYDSLAMVEIHKALEKFTRRWLKFVVREGDIEILRQDQSKTSSSKK